MCEVAVTVSGDDDVLVAVQALCQSAVAHGMPPRQVASLELVVRELAWNLARHAHGGVMQLTHLEEAGRRGVAVAAIDRGTGICSLRRTGGLGAGLGLVQRRSAEFSLTSSEAGTKIQAVMWWVCTSL